MTAIWFWHDPQESFLTLPVLKSTLIKNYSACLSTTNKWRDDPRPRAGLIRVREFTMKDSYSFDRDYEG